MAEGYYSSKPVATDTSASTRHHPPLIAVSEPATPTVSAPPSPIPPTSAPPSPTTSSSQPSDRDRGRALFSPNRRSRSADRVCTKDVTIRQVSEGEAVCLSTKPDMPFYSFRKGSGSSPDVSTAANTDGTRLERGHVRMREASHSTVDLAAPDTPIQFETKSVALPKKSKPRPFAHLLSRNRSTRGEPISATASNDRFPDPERGHHKLDDPGLKTAPLNHEADRSFRDMMNSSLRNRSADRQRLPGPATGAVPVTKENAKLVSLSSSLKEGGGGTFLSNLRTTSTRAADGIGKAGKGIFGKLARSGSSGERDAAESKYTCSVITLPLVEQTRLTRISKRLEDSRDKTEFWMPALPWRCIDFLNLKGCEEEGLYRIPGSLNKVKYWEKRFDTELDVNLLQEPDLYDINIVGSMFKNWLRELPDELFPRSIQARITERCEGATEVPQMLKDELSRLPPYNYYLLFAITCHLNILNSCEEQNKMSFNNLKICFQPSLKINTFCFKFLVCEWKHCWQGCLTEAAAMAEERRILNGLPPAQPEANAAGSREVMDDRAISSSGSSNPPSFNPSLEERRKTGVTKDKSIEHEEAVVDVSPNVSEESVCTTEKTLEKPALSPYVPLSPLHI